MDLFHPADHADLAGSHAEEENRPVTIINPRGFRAYVRNDTFFHAIPYVLKSYPRARFICPGMKGEAQAEKWMSELRLRDEVALLPNQTRQQMAELFRKSAITVSITTHDGTPNTLVEALACGCFPIAGDIESLREWISPGENGLLVDPGDPRALADAIVQAISKPELRQAAREKNLRMVKERAEYRKCMGMVAEWYQRVIG
jgi:glycosyltransferase involved in cell wall biosynthesis